MAGSYCMFCGHRCFVSRWLPEDHPSHATHFATCSKGAELDRESTGYDYTTAFNPMERWREGETDTERQARYEAFYKKETAV